MYHALSELEKAVIEEDFDGQCYLSVIAFIRNFGFGFKDN